MYPIAGEDIVLPDWLTHHPRIKPNKARTPSQPTFRTNSTHFSNRSPLNSTSEFSIDLTYTSRLRIFDKRQSPSRSVLSFPGSGALSNRHVCRPHRPSPAQSHVLSTNIAILQKENTTGPTATYPHICLTCRLLHFIYHLRLRWYYTTP